MTDEPATKAPVRRGRGGFARSDLGLGILSSLAATGLRFVGATSSMTYVPKPPEDYFREFAPFILTAWHGQAFMLPFLRPPAYPVDVLASRHADGELIARTLVKLGCGVVRGSGSADPARMHEKGAVAGFRGMKSALDSGHSVALTADFMRDARRKVSPGVIALSRFSRRPIMPVAFVSSRRREVGSSWDRTTISLPFGRCFCVVADPLIVEPRADADELERMRVELERRLNEATERAYALADGRG